jgi:hypothetical protein
MEKGMNEYLKGKEGSNFDTMFNNMLKKCNSEIEREILKKCKEQLYSEYIKQEKETNKLSEYKEIKITNKETGWEHTYYIKK